VLPSLSSVNACVAVSPIRCVAVMPPGVTVSEGGTSSRGVTTTG
jgi:hypothetical protein